MNPGRGPGNVEARSGQVLIVVLFGLAFLAVSLFGVHEAHGMVLWTGSALIAATVTFARRRKMSRDCAVGVAAVVLLGAPLVAMPIIGHGERQGPALVAAGLAVATAGMAWAVARCPCRMAEIRGSGWGALKQGLLWAYAMAVVLSLWGLIGLWLYPQEITSVFLRWTVIGYFATATVVGSLYPLWRHLLRYPVGALLVGGISGTILYLSIVPAEIVRDSGDLSWEAAQTHVGIAVIAGFVVGPVLLLHFTFKETDKDVGEQ